MPLLPLDTSVVLQGICTIEDAEPLLKWLIDNPGGNVELTDCLNVHTAVLQTLMASDATCTGQTADAALNAWLESALRHNRLPALHDSAEPDKGN